MSGFDFSQFLRGVASAQRKQIAAAEKAVAQFAEHVVGGAQELAPVDTGALKASATASDTQLDGDRISAELGFNTEYAAAVHERLDVHHPQGEAKYLENSLRKNGPKFGPFIAAQVKGAIG